MKKRLPFPIWILWVIRIFSIICNVTAQAVIETDTIVDGNNPTGYGNGYIVLGGAYLAFQEMNSAPMYQTVKVDKGGALYYINDNMKGFDISSSHALFGDFVFQNDGIVVVDDRKSTSSGSWTINDGTFTNTGHMMFTSSQGDTIGIYASSTTNTGLIYSKGTDRNKPQQVKISSGNNWINTGTICLANSTYKLSKAIHGGGCISVGEGSVFNIYDYDMQQQTIYLSHSSSVLAFTNGQNVAVHGLGNGNGFLYPIFPIRKVTYNSLTGIATFTTGFISLQKFTVDIGLGYNESDFEIVKSINIQGTNYNNYNFVIYKGPTPNSAPSVCQPCIEIPLYTFKVPNSYETINDLGFSETISFFSTYNSNDLPMIGTTTIFSPPDVYTLTRYNESTTETNVVSKVTGIDLNGSPFAYYTTITIEDKKLPEVVTTTITVTNEDGSENTITTVKSNSPTMDSFTSSRPSNSFKTVSSMKDKGLEGKDSISTTITTNSDGKPTTIFDINSSNDNIDKTVIRSNSESLTTTVISSYNATTNSNGNFATMVTTSQSPLIKRAAETAVLTDSQGNVITEVISMIQATDPDGVIYLTLTTMTPTANPKVTPTNVVTTYPPSIITGVGDTMIVTDNQGHVFTEVVSQLVIEGANGTPSLTLTTMTLTDNPKVTPTNVVTTYSPSIITGVGDTMIVTDNQGHVFTEVVSQLVIEGANGTPSLTLTTMTLTDNPKVTPTNVVTTYPTSKLTGVGETMIVTDNQGHVFTEVVSQLVIEGANGTPSLTLTTMTLTDNPKVTPTNVVTTYPTSKLTGVGETMIVTDNQGHVFTEVVSLYETLDKNGHLSLCLTTMTLPDDHTSIVTGTESSAPTKVETTYPGSGLVTLTVTDSQGHLTTETISWYVTTYKDGVVSIYETTVTPTTNPNVSPTKVETTYPGSGLVTLTVTDSQGHLTTETISWYITTYKDGVVSIYETTLTPSMTTDEYTTAITSSDFVSHITTTDSNGKLTTIVTTVITYTTVTTVINYPTQVETTTDYSTVSNGKPTTMVTTIPLTKPSGEADYTTVITGSDSMVHTDLVSHITTTGSNGKPTTMVTTIPLTKPSGEADYTTVITGSDSMVHTDLVSHITTTGSNGKPTTMVTTIPLTKPSGEADYTTVITGSDSMVHTDLVSHITTTGSNGKPTTMVTTIPLTKPSGEADYTTVITGSDSMATPTSSPTSPPQVPTKPTTWSTIPLTKPNGEATTPPWSQL
ncbi:hypothetical protein J7297_03010 [Nakaseomyces glabratus]|nr:hypothetical protein J7297_03010 [Nakaseomyces glabratus]